MIPHLRHGVNGEEKKKMNQETRQCQNCKKDFTIEPEDFNFYEKIKVPPPTFCPECRMVRRMLWRNENTLFKTKCQAPGHDEYLISIFPPNGVVVYDQKFWWSDNFDAISYGRNYDFRRPFFEQFSDLLKVIPFANMISRNNINSDYSNFLTESKNCYLANGGRENENTLFSNHMFYCRDSSDLYFVKKTELSYENIMCLNSFKLFYAQNCENCRDSYFLFDCRNCSDCFGCVGLRNKQYNFFNEQLSAENYHKKLEEINLGDYQKVEKYKKIFSEFKLRFPVKFSNSVRAINSTGDNITDARNCHHAFDVLAGGSDNCKYVFWTGENMKDVYDGVGCGVNSEVSYEVVTTTIGTARMSFTSAIWGGHDIYYSYNCHNSCHHLFGCIGLRQKSYCIFNKQYTKEEYEKLISQIIEHMKEMPFVDKKGVVYKFGEFFPSEISPYAYNQTLAQEYFPLNEEEAIIKGYRWEKKEERNYKIDINVENILNDIKDVDDSILNKIIECEHKGVCEEQCTEAFKIIDSELNFYKRMNLPIPHLCPGCRFYQRLKKRNPLKLWHRKCMNEGCSNEFETAYSPDRPEKVYCESCYNKEIY
jgi:hypothetical protein